jgi:hypothetical protein
MRKTTYGSGINKHPHVYNAFVIHLNRVKNEWLPEKCSGSHHFINKTGEFSNL